MVVEIGALCFQRIVQWAHDGPTYKRGLAYALEGRVKLVDFKNENGIRTVTFVTAVGAAEGSNKEQQQRDGVVGEGDGMMSSGGDNAPSALETNAPVVSQGCKRTRVPTEKAQGIPKKKARQGSAK